MNRTTNTKPLGWLGVLVLAFLFMGMNAGNAAAQNYFIATTPAGAMDGSTAADPDDLSGGIAAINGGAATSLIIVDDAAGNNFTTDGDAGANGLEGFTIDNNFGLSTTVAGVDVTFGGIVLIAGQQLDISSSFGTVNIVFVAGSSRNINLGAGAVLTAPSVDFAVNQSSATSLVIGNNASFTFAGTTFASNFGFSVGSGATFTINAGGTFTQSALAFSVNTVNGGTLNVNGTLGPPLAAGATVNAGGMINVGGTGAINATVNLNGGGQLVNNGTVKGVSVGSGGTFGGTGTFAGDFSGHAVTITQGGTATLSSSVTVTGDVRVGLTTFPVGEGTLNLAGFNLDASGNPIVINPDQNGTPSTLNLQGGTITGTTLTNNTGLNGPGAVVGNVVNNGPLGGDDITVVGNLTQNTGSWGTGFDVIVDGTAAQRTVTDGDGAAGADNLGNLTVTGANGAVTGGAVSFASNLTVNAGSSLTLAGAVTGVTNVTISGALMTAGFDVTAGGLFSMPAGGSLDQASGGTITANSINLAAGNIPTNPGAVNSATDFFAGSGYGGGVTLSTNAAGLLDVNTAGGNPDLGSLTTTGNNKSLAQNVGIAGNVTVGGTFDLDGFTLNAAANTITNNSTFDLSGGMAVAGTFTNGGTLNGTGTVAANLTNNNTLGGGDITVAGNLMQSAASWGTGLDVIIDGSAALRSITDSDGSTTTDNLGNLVIDGANGAQLLTDLSFASDLTVNAGSYLDLNGNNINGITDASFAGTVDADGSITGGGDLDIGGTLNQMSGLVQFQSGTVTLMSTGTLDQGGGFLLYGGDVIFQAGATVNNPGAVSSNGDFTSPFGYGGSVALENVSNGTLNVNTVGINPNLASLTVNGANKELGTDLDVDGNVTIQTNGQLTVDPFDMNVGGNLSNNGGASPTLAAGNTVFVSGDFTNATGYTGSVVLNGTAAQDIIGIGQFDNLMLDGTGPYDVQNQIIDFIGELNINTGTLNIGNWDFVLSPTASLVVGNGKWTDATADNPPAEPAVPVLPPGNPADTFNGLVINTTNNTTLATGFPVSQTGTATNGDVWAYSDNAAPFDYVNQMTDFHARNILVGDNVIWDTNGFTLFSNVNMTYGTGQLQANGVMVFVNGDEIETMIYNNNIIIDAGAGGTVTVVDNVDNPGNDNEVLMNQGNGSFVMRSGTLDLNTHNVRTFGSFEYEGGNIITGITGANQNVNGGTVEFAGQNVQQATLLIANDAATVTFPRIIFNRANGVKIVDPAPNTTPATLRVTERFESRTGPVDAGNNNILYTGSTGTMQDYTTAANEESRRVIIHSQLTGTGEFILANASNVQAGVIDGDGDARSFERGGIVMRGDQANQMLNMSLRQTGSAFNTLQDIIQFGNGTTSTFEAGHTRLASVTRVNGGVEIDGGTLIVSNPTQFGGSTPVDLSSGDVFLFNGTLFFENGADGDSHIAGLFNTDNGTVEIGNGTFSNVDLNNPNPNEPGVVGDVDGDGLEIQVPGSKNHNVVLMGNWEQGSPGAIFNMYAQNASNLVFGGSTAQTADLDSPTTVGRVTVNNPGGVSIINDLLSVTNAGITGTPNNGRSATLFLQDGILDNDVPSLLNIGGSIVVRNRTTTGEDGRLLNELQDGQEPDQLRYIGDEDLTTGPETGSTTVRTNTVDRFTVDNTATVFVDREVRIATGGNLDGHVGILDLASDHFILGNNNGTGIVTITRGPNSDLQQDQGLLTFGGPNIAVNINYFGTTTTSYELFADNSRNNNVTLMGAAPNPYNGSQIPLPYGFDPDYRITQHADRQVNGNIDIIDGTWDVNNMTLTVHTGQANDKGINNAGGENRTTSISLNTDADGGNGAPAVDIIGGITDSGDSGTLKFTGDGITNVTGFVTNAMTSVDAEVDVVVDKQIDDNPDSRLVNIVFVLGANVGNYHFGTSATDNVLNIRNFLGTHGVVTIDGPDTRTGGAPFTSGGIDEFNVTNNLTQNSPDVTSPANSAPAAPGWTLGTQGASLWVGNDQTHTAGVTTVGNARFVFTGNDFTQSGGTFNASTLPPTPALLTSFTVGGNHTQSGGTISLNQSFDTDITGDLTITGGTFNANGGAPDVQLNNDVTQPWLNAANFQLGEEAPTVNSTFNGIGAPGVPPVGYTLGGVPPMSRGFLSTIPGTWTVNVDPDGGRTRMNLQGNTFAVAGDVTMLGSGDDITTGGTAGDTTDNSAAFTAATGDSRRGLDGTIILNGTVPQTIVERQHADAFFNHITIMNGAGVDVDSDGSDLLLNRSGVLNLSDGNIRTTGEGKVVIFNPTGAPNSGNLVAGAVINGGNQSFVQAPLVRAQNGTASGGPFAGSVAYNYPVGVVEGGVPFYRSFRDTMPFAQVATVFFKAEAFNDTPADPMGFPIATQENPPLMLGSISNMRWVIMTSDFTNFDPDVALIATGMRNITTNLIDNMRIIYRQNGDTTDPFELAGRFDNEGTAADGDPNNSNDFVAGAPFFNMEGINGFREEALAWEFAVAGRQVDHPGFGTPVTDGQVATGNVTGTVLFGDTDTGVEGVDVTLWQNGTQLDATTTDADGNFSFADVEDGEYTIVATVPDGTEVQGITGADALGIVNNFVGNADFTDFQAAQADVNGDGRVNSADALLVAQRAAGTIATFPAGDFVSAHHDVTVANGSAGTELMVGAYGDVNQSGGFGAVAAAKTDGPRFESLTTSVDGQIQANTGAETTIDVPVRVKSAMDLGALTMQVTYPAETVTFDGVTSAFDGMITNEAPGMVTIVWFDATAKNAVSLASGDELMTLRFTASNAEEGASFTPALYGELVDAEANVLTAALSTDEVEFSTLPTTFALLGNYPNPFNPSTTITFDLPVEAQVSVEVIDMLGRRVMALPAQQMSAGAAKSVQIDASRLASGSYFYRVIARGADKTFVKSSQMTLIK